MHAEELPFRFTMGQGGREEQRKKRRRTEREKEVGGGGESAEYNNQIKTGRREKRDCLSRNECGYEDAYE